MPSMCFTPPAKQLSSTGGHMNQIHGNRDRLIEDIRVCGQFLNGLDALSGEMASNSTLLSFVEACERVVVALGREQRIQSQEGRAIQGLIRKDWRLSSGEIPGTTPSVPRKHVAASHATILEHTLLDYGKDHSELKYRREEICEDKVCAVENLHDICKVQKIDPNMAQTCKMCFPEKNTQLINAHCQAKWKREQKAFYVVSFVLIGITLISGLILYIRRRYLRAKNPHADENATNETGINPPGELYYYDGPRSILPTERHSSLAVNCSPEPRQNEDSKRYHNSWDDNEDGVISTSAAHRRLKQLGILSRTGRKKIHDLFDLEALQSRRGTIKDSQRRSDEKDRVPVMPWAPNASVRLSSRSSPTVRQATRSKTPSAVELQEMA
ncbi:conserved hypothetical protein [Talaromyces stipitatus ATCC 10500]|uniref:Uncharacterized protein n=1 Tax=Talaromyces stipitatus (strain ATCC 10500 / CBS 375.48 / QM 6759 / NRRL 1006) TaxID=441959 RepID=B8LVV3_TALSN|nr:uncharacterized protein TSTA_076840 [Talaromyces stipitatus ATCC 10500]EED24319.1 conserved hypothetical protein [Talaromyces stipitatus ATCC 10500]